MEKQILERVRTERPLAYFKARVRLFLVQHPARDKATDFDRVRNRREVLQRLDARLADARTLPEQLKAGHRPGQSTRPW